MTAFLISLAILIVGYFVYSKIIDRVLATDSKRTTPACSMNDGVDYIPMPTWRVFLIQFLNIAGLGPIFGAIMGVMFGPAAFLWIAIGTIFAGGVHDFISGTISLRRGGESLPEIIGQELGITALQFTRWFSVIVLILVGSVFILTPADLLSGITPDWMNRYFWIVVIFAYYILATLLPIDKIIGKVYPLFGIALLFMAVGLLGVLLVGDVTIPVDFADGFQSRGATPVFPMMFVSIACGAISGFHATQSPMMARCMTNERHARSIFYGAMVAEGIVALIWAAAAVTFLGGYDALNEYMHTPGHSQGTLVSDISIGWLGKVGGILALLGVIFAPITTGDTALRSARLTVADVLKIDQKKVWRRLAISVPIFIVVVIIINIDFQILWRYFAWSNQTLAAFTLWAITVFLARYGKPYVIGLLPAVFMTLVCSTYFFCAPRPEGLGLSIAVAGIIGGAITAAITTLFFVMRPRLRPHKNFKY